MRTAETVSIGEQYFWQALAAAVVAGLLLAIPTPVVAETKKEMHALHPVSPAIHGLMAQSRITETSRLAPPSATHEPKVHPNAMPHAFRKLPHHQPGIARQEASLLRRMTLARIAPLSHSDHPQKPMVLQNGQIRIVDGDTFAVGNERFRIRGINAPETTEAGGFDATQRLDSLLHDGPVLAIPYGQDAYGRTLVEVYVNNRDVAEVMKEEGHNKQR